MCCHFSCNNQFWEKFLVFDSARCDTFGYVYTIEYWVWMSHRVSVDFVEAGMKNIRVLEGTSMNFNRNPESFSFWVDLAVFCPISIISKTERGMSSVGVYASAKAPTWRSLKNSWLFIIVFLVCFHIFAAKKRRQTLIFALFYLSLSWFSVNRRETNEVMSECLKHSNWGQSNRRQRF